MFGPRHTGAAADVHDSQLSEIRHHLQILNSLQSVAASLELIPAFRDVDGTVTHGVIHCAPPIFNIRRKLLQQVSIQQLPEHVEGRVLFGPTSTPRLRESLGHPHRNEIQLVKPQSPRGISVSR